MKNRIYEISSDENNFTLRSRYITNKGNEKSQIIGYFPNLKALKAYAVNHCLRVDGLNALENIELKLKGILEVKE